MGADEEAMGVGASKGLARTQNQSRVKGRLNIYLRTSPLSPRGEIWSLRSSGSRGCRRLRLLQLCYSPLPPLHAFMNYSPCRSGLDR